MEPVEISRGLYLVPEKRYLFYVDNLEHNGTFVTQEGKNYVFKEVIIHLPMAWGAGDCIPEEIGTRKLKGESICELVQIN